jgi:hypothetical protein
VDRIRAVAPTLHLHLGRESWRTVVPLSSANARIWHRRTGVSKVFSTAFGASVGWKAWVTSMSGISPLWLIASWGWRLTRAVVRKSVKLTVAGRSFGIVGL